MTGDPPDVRSSADIGEPSRRAKPDSGHPVDHLTSSESMEGPMIAPHGGPRWPRPPCRPGGRGLSRHDLRVEQWNSSSLMTPRVTKVGKATARTAVLLPSELVTLWTCWPNAVTRASSPWPVGTRLR